MSQTLTISDSTVVAFRPDGARIRRPIAGEEVRGAILLFTGVRYERPVVAPPKVRRRTKSRPEEA